MVLSLQFMFTYCFRPAAFSLCQTVKTQSFSCHVGSPPGKIPEYFNKSSSVFTITHNCRGAYKDNLCLFRTVVCALVMKKRLEKCRPQTTKLAAVKEHYETLRTSCMLELPKNCKNFQSSTLDEMDTACQKRKPI